MTNIERRLEKAEQALAPRTFVAALITAYDAQPADTPLTAIS
jgi:hypothetical protein